MEAEEKGKEKQWSMRRNSRQVEEGRKEGSDEREDDEEMEKRLVKGNRFLASAPLVSYPEHLS